MHGNMKNDEAKARASGMVALGNERMAAGDANNARAMFLGAVDADPGCAEAYHKLGNLINSSGRYEASAALQRKSLALDPSNAEAWNDLGNTLWRVQDFPNAEVALLRALKLNDKHPGFHHNMGLLYYSVGKPLLGAHHLRRSLDLKPDNIPLRHDLALTVLKSGDLLEGLKLSEVRWNGMLNKSMVWDTGVVRWTGEDLNDKTIIIHREQGFGDSVQFIRFIPQLKKKWPRAKVVFASPNELIRLLTGRCEVDEIIDIDQPGQIVKVAMKADYHSPLISVLPLIGSTYGNLPSAGPYLRALRPSPRGVRRTSPTFNIGLVWSASSGYERSRQRSVPLPALVTLGELRGVKLHSLQVGEFNSELVKFGAENLIVDATNGIRDFADTANVMDTMDLIITVDTVAVHIAGALGRPTFMFNPINPCWRWARGAEPWYSSVRLFNQVDPNNWDEPIERMKFAIVKMMKGDDNDQRKTKRRGSRTSR
jgi:Tfp pilus assembly protein PilF